MASAEGHLYVQVILLPYGMLFFHVVILVLHFLHILFMSYILGTLFVLTSLLADAAFSCRAGRQVGGLDP